MNHSSSKPKRKAVAKTVDQRFASWWERNAYLHYMPTSEDDLRGYMRLAYYHGWSACKRTKR